MLDKFLISSVCAFQTLSTPVPCKSGQKAARQEASNCSSGLKVGSRGTIEHHLTQNFIFMENFGEILGKFRIPYLP